MKAILLVAHGSRRQHSNDEVRHLAGKLNQRCSNEFPIILPAFLELAEPLIPDGLQQCIDKGASSITVLPYFLNTGRHVAEDIPGIVSEFMQQSPVDIQIASHLGASDMMLELLASVAMQD